MKTLITVLFLTIIAGSIFSACKKSDNTDTANEISRVTKMLEGKWVFASYSSNHHQADKDNVKTTMASPGDYITFASDGKLLIRFLGFDDVSTYSVREKNKIAFYGPDVFELKTLTATRLEIYRKYQISTTDYSEETYVCTR